MVNTANSINSMLLSLFLPHLSAQDTLISSTSPAHLQIHVPSCKKHYHQVFHKSCTLVLVLGQVTVVLVDDVARGYMLPLYAHPRRILSRFADDA